MGGGTQTHNRTHANHFTDRGQHLRPKLAIPLEIMFGIQQRKPLLEGKRKILKIKARFKEITWTY